MNIAFKVIIIVLFSLMLFIDDEDKEWVAYARVFVIVANLVSIYFDIRKIRKKRLEKQP